MTDEATNVVVEAEDDLPEQMRVRREKRERLLAAGVEPYPVQVPVTTTIAAIRSAHGHLEIGRAHV